MKFVGDVTLSEYGDMLLRVAERLRGQWAWLDIRAEGDWPTLRVEADGFQGSLELSPVRGFLDRQRMIARVGAAISPTGPLEAARKAAFDLTAVCDALTVAKGLLADIQVWVRGCPCGSCGGRGAVRGGPCHRCEGTGLKDPSDRPAADVLDEEKAGTL